MNKQITLEDYPSLKAAHDFVRTVPNALIAGGCPRDILLGREFKDVDIFISGYGEGLEPLAAAFQIGWAVVDLGIKLTHAGNEYYNHFLYRWRSDHLDILLVRYFASGQSLVDTFDVGLCQAWMTPTEDGFAIDTTPAFDQHLEHKILGYFEDGENGARIERMKKKFADFLPVSMKRGENNDLPF